MKRSTKQPPPPRNFCGLPGIKATSCLTIVMLICLETVLLSTVSNCAKTFYMHWNTSNSIFRIDNTDHIIDVNKGNLAFEFDQVHIICPLYEPGTFENETEKYIIYNVSKVEYETCRITNADPRVIAICDKPQKLMFFTITFRPFTPQPGGLEFLPGNDYYFISTSSKDDLYRRIGGRCSTHNMKVVFKVCCPPEEHQNNTLPNGQSGGLVNSGGNIGTTHQHNNNINLQNGIGPSGQPASGGSVSINTNIDQFNRIPMTQGGGAGIRINNVPQSNGNIHSNGGFIPPLANVNTNNSNIVQSTMSWPVWNNQNGINIQHSTPITTVGIQQQQPFYPSHMTSPRPNINSAIHNNSLYSPSHKPTKKTNEYDKHPNEVVKNEELTYNSGADRLIFKRIYAYKYLHLCIIYNNPIIILTILLVILTNLLDHNYGVVSSYWCQR